MEAKAVFLCYNVCTAAKDEEGGNMKNLKWRLKELPATEEVINLLNSGVITKEEAKAIFFSDGDEKVATSELQEIKDELSLLRKLVTATSQTTIIKEIQQVPHYYLKKPWYAPYEVLCSTYTTGSLPNSSVTTTGLYFNTGTTNIVN
jgi:hypothetical protein